MRVWGSEQVKLMGTCSQRTWACGDTPKLGLPVLVYVSFSLRNFKALTYYTPMMMMILIFMYVYVYVHVHVHVCLCVCVCVCVHAHINIMCIPYSVFRRSKSKWVENENWLRIGGVVEWNSQVGKKKMLLLVY